VDSYFPPAAYIYCLRGFLGSSSFHFPFSALSFPLRHFGEKVPTPLCCVDVFSFPLLAHPFARGLFIGLCFSLPTPHTVRPPPNFVCKSFTHGWLDRCFHERQTSRVCPPSRFLLPRPVSEKVRLPPLFDLYRPHREGGFGERRTGPCNLTSPFCSFFSLPVCRRSSLFQSATLSIVIQIRREKLSMLLSP